MAQVSGPLLRNRRVWAPVGGVTTIATTTLIGREPLPELFSRAIKCGESRSWCDFKVTCVVNTLDQVKQIPAVASQGGVSYKFFTGYAGAQAEGFGMSKEGISPAFFYEACRSINAAGRRQLAQETEDWQRMSSTIDRFLGPIPEEV